MPQTLCLVCGAHRNEVDKMHYFPTNLEKSKIWQESIGIKYIPGLSLRGYLICSKHFTVESYVNLATRKLRTDVIPSLFPCSVQEERHPKTVLQSITAGSSVEEGEEVTNIGEELNLQSTPSTSGMQPRPSTPKASPRHSIFRGILGVSRVDATPRKQRLMQMVISKESYVRKLKKLCRKRSTDIKALTNLNDSTVVRNLFKDMPSRTADFLISQLRCAKRSPKGRRWTADEKIIALALLKKSPRCYNLLRKIVALPSKKTVLTLLQQVPFSTGINDHLFKHVAECFATNEQDKHCVLLFDEMDIKENLYYDPHLDRIIGFEELDIEFHSTKFANRALVFMLQGLSRNWKQPVAYYFCNGPCPPHILKRCLQNVIKASEEIAGVHIISTICDMGSTNVRTLKDMGSSIEHPYIMVNNKKIFTMFDPPHLLKCTVSLFRKHNVLIPVTVANEKQIMEARFNDIVQAHSIDQQSPLVFRAMHKIKDSHLAPVMQYAMKVNLAAQLMSRTVAAFLYTLLSRGELEQRSLATATFVRQVDDLFDSFNGSRATPPEGKELKCNVTEVSEHFNYWSQAFNMVRQWQFKRFTKTGGVKTSKPPSQIGWMTTLRAIKAIWMHLHIAEGFQSLRPRSLNQDSLENLFGAIRGGCGCSDNPTAVQFTGSLKTQILNGLAQQAIVGSNCEEDDCQLLTNLRTFLNVDKQQETVPLSSVPSTTDESNSETTAEAVKKAVESGATETLSVAYVSGFIAKKLLEELNCQICHELLLTTSDAPHNIFITYKEWSEKGEHLTYPSEALVVAVGHSVTILEGTLDTLCYRSHLTEIISMQILENVLFDGLSCSAHQNIVIQGIMRAVCRIGIPWWCKRKNREQVQVRKDARKSKRKVKKFKHK